MKGLCHCNKMQEYYEENESEGICEVFFNCREEKDGLAWCGGRKGKEKGGCHNHHSNLCVCVF